MGVNRSERFAGGTCLYRAILITDHANIELPDKVRVADPSQSFMKTTTDASSRFIDRTTRTGEDIFADYFLPRDKNIQGRGGITFSSQWST